MSWLVSIAIGVLTAAVGCVGAGLVAGLCARWYRISSFEGASGYYVVGIALLGMVVGLIVGIVGARIVAAGAAPGFGKGLGVALGSMSGLLLVSCFLAWMAADLRPEIGGRELELAIEVRGPQDFVMPPQLDQHDAFASVYVPRGRTQRHGDLRFDEATRVDGRWIVSATVPLQTSAADKYLRVYFNKDSDAMFGLRLPRHPSKKNFAWSAWVESGWDVGKPEPAPEQKFNLRYRVQQVAVPPPAPTMEEMEAKEAAEEQAKFNAIAADAPIPEWLPYTRYGADEERLKIAIGHITSRANFVAELTPLMDSEDQEVASDALRMIEHIPAPPAELLAPVAASGQSIANRIRKVNTTSAAADPSYLGAANVSVRFSAWMVAVRTLRERSGGDFTPELREILELARVRPDSHALRGDVVRVASFYLHQWIGLEPLPTDPPPR